VGAAEISEEGRRRSRRRGREEVAVEKKKNH
jgi:hypothetical protein